MTVSTNEDAAEGTSTPSRAKEEQHAMGTPAAALHTHSVIRVLSRSFAARKAL